MIPVFSGYPEHMTFGEFHHRFSILAPPESRQSQPVLDERKVGYPLRFSGGSRWGWGGGGGGGGAALLGERRAGQMYEKPANPTP